VAGDAPTEEQLDRLLLASNDGSSDAAAMRAALLLSAAGAEQEQEQEVAEVERGLVELQQLFLDMAALVEAQGAPLDDIERQVGAAAGDVAAAEAELSEARRLQGSARRRRVYLAGGIAALLLVGVAVAVVVALVLARRGSGGGKLVLQLAKALPAR
jgi:syntaxin 1B/2/3